MNIIGKISNWYFKKNALPYWAILLIDSCLVILSGYLASVLVEESGPICLNFWSLTVILLLNACVYNIFFKVFHTFSGIIRFSSFCDLERVFFANLCGFISMAGVSIILRYYDKVDIEFPKVLTLLVSFILSTFFMIILRITVKALYDIIRIDSETKNVFIYGVQAGGVGIAKSIQNQSPQKFKVVGFVSPDKNLYSQYLMGVLVRHDGERLVEHMQEKNAEILIVSPLQTEHFRKKQDLINDLLSNGIKILVYPQAEEWDGTSDLHQENLREVDIEDLLPREKIEVDMDAIGKILTGANVLVTGAAGSIGSELVKQIAFYNPAQLILVDQAETPMHDLRLTMAKVYPNIKAETIVASINDKIHMEHIFAEYRPEFVFHAAAYKHVPMMEDNPTQAIRNNVLGTRVVADLSVKYGTNKFVMISTDKAVNPTNVMGCSKRICEIYCQSLNQAIVSRQVQGATQFITTRFGNVLGSNGSVIPLFKKQIQEGGPVTVTHPDIIRYFMLIPEACRLVLEAGTMGKGGEIFAFDMGNPVKIVDVARKMIKLSGAQNIDIVFTGLRDGEKLYEEVLSSYENTMPTNNPKILVAKVREYDYDMVCKNVNTLSRISELCDDMKIVKLMKVIVPEYKSRQSKYECLD